MRKVYLSALLILVVGFSVSEAQFHDPDGILGAGLVYPTTGNPFDHFVVSYDINGVVDSIVVETTANFDSSVVLANPGDSCIARMIAISVFNDTSNVITSPIAYYADPSGIGDPGFFWIPDSSPPIRIRETPSE